VPRSDPDTFLHVKPRTIMNVKTPPSPAPTPSSTTTISRPLVIIIGAVAVLACVASIYLLLRPAASTRTGIVRVNTVLERYQGAQDARQAFQRTAGAWQANVDTLKAELQTMIMDYERERSGLSAAEQQGREQALHAKEAQVREYASAIMQRMEQEQQVLTGGIASQVKTAAEEIGKQHGYDLVLAIQDEGMLLYQSEMTDVTPIVLEYLRTHYSGSFKGSKDKKK